MDYAEHFIDLAFGSWRRFSVDFGEKMRFYGLTVAQSQMIREIGTSDGSISKVDLARVLGVNRSMVTNTLKGLERYIVITAVDKRKSLMTLSEEGIALYGRIIPAMRESARSVVDDLSKKDVEVLKNIAKKNKKGH